MEAVKEISTSTAERLGWDSAPGCEGYSEVYHSASSIGDPWEWYTSLHQKYLEEAEECLNRGELTQASEKYWGATAYLAKAIAASEGEELKHHSNIGRYVTSKLARRDPELRDLYSAANSLHTNFYENNLDKETVGRYAEKVRKFTLKFRGGKQFSLTSPE